MIVTSQSEWYAVHWATCGLYGYWLSNLTFKMRAVSFVHWPTCFTLLQIQQSILNFQHLLVLVASLTPALAKVSQGSLISSVHRGVNWHPSCSSCFCAMWITRHLFKGVLETSTMKMEVHISEALSLMMVRAVHLLDSTDSNLGRPYRERWDD